MKKSTLNNQLEKTIKKINENLINDNKHDFDFIELHGNFIHFFSDGIFVSKFDLMNQKMFFEQDLNLDDFLFIFKVKCFLNKNNLI